MLKHVVFHMCKTNPIKKILIVFAILSKSLRKCYHLILQQLIKWQHEWGKEHHF
jgi:hypothetical protein